MNPATGAPAVLRVGEDGEGLAACVHCGLCLPACPTFEVLREENDSPRGRIYLMRLLVEGRIPALGAFSRHIDRCLGCRACEAACPAGVRFGTLLERAREDRRRWAGSSPLASLMLWGLSGGRASRVAYALLRFLRRTGMAAAGASLPGRMGVALAMLAATAPSAQLPRRAGTQSSGKLEVYALLQGCVMGGLFREVHTATRRVLSACGYVERAAPGQGCCGALHAHSGFGAGARKLARRNIEAFERSGAAWLVVNSAGCGAALKEYPEWLAESPTWRERAERLASATRDFTELVADAHVRPETELSLRLAYDAPCHLVYGLGGADAPMRALSLIPGLQVERLPSADRCCGGAGLYALLQPDLAERVLAPKLEEIRSGRYDAVTTGNPGCIMQIGAGLRRAKLHVPVAHPAEVLARAFAPSGPPGTAATPNWDTGRP